MSAPIRARIEDNEVPTAEAIRAEQAAEQPTPAESDRTIEPPRVMFPDQLVSQHLAENPGTVQKTEHASAKPLVVRTLKDPPEIWDLVHETPAQFDPSGAFVARLTSSKTKFVLLMLGVIFISGLAAFAFMTLRDGRKRGDAVAQAQLERSTSQTVAASQASAPDGAPVSAPARAAQSSASAPETAPNAPVNTSPGAESGVANTAPQPTAPPLTDPQATTPQPKGSQLTNPQPTVPSPNTAAFAGQEVTDNIQPTGVSEAQAKANAPVVNNISKRTTSLPRRAAAWARNKQVTVASGSENIDKPGDKPSNNPADKPSDKPSPTRGANPAAGRDASAGRQSPQETQTADLKREHEKSSSESASAGTKSNTTLSPQLIAPPTTTSAPKAKVIQWP